MAEISRVGREAGDDGRQGGESTDQPPSLWRRFKTVFSKTKEDGNGLRETIEDLIVEAGEDGPQIDHDERELIANVLRLRDQRVDDAMIPRVDIVAIDLEADRDELFGIINDNPHSRFPVYRENMDDIVGVLHIKDILTAVSRNEEIVIGNLLRDVLTVSPAMRVSDLLLEMREKRIHMAVVVDEFGGIDGLATIEDLVELVVGDIQDEHDNEDEVQLVHKADGSILADARLFIEDFEDELGRQILSDEQREDIDTLGGYVADLAGQVPAAGSVIQEQELGLEIEIVEADLRRIHRIRVRDLLGRDDAEPAESISTIAAQ